MKILVSLSRLVGKVLDFLVALLIIVILLYSSYSLYSSYMLYKGAFVSDTLLKVKPFSDEKAGEKLSFEGLLVLNRDAVAWLTIENTNIDYPLVKGKTNLEYINKNIYGDFALEGSIFIDSRNRGDFTDPYNLLYGHHMENGAMFGDLEKFFEKDFFEKNNYGSLLTPKGKYRIDFFALVKADAYDKYIFNPTEIKNYEDKLEFLSYISSKSVQYRDIDIKKDDNLIALSTCESIRTNGRTILYGRLVKLK